MNNKQNDIATSSSVTGRYVPPHERRRLQEQKDVVPVLTTTHSNAHLNAHSNQNDNPSTHHQLRSTAFSGSNRMLSNSLNNSFTNSRNSLTSSAGGRSSFNQSKWKDSHTQYGPDGLFPENKRLEDELFVEENSGINFEKYDDIPIDVQDYDTHVQIEKFTDIDLGPVLYNNLNLSHFDSPTPIQKISIPIALKGRDLMACAQTGSGKTAAFLFPLIAMIIKDYNSNPPKNPGRKVSPECLILAPTRELAIQIHKNARKFTYRSHIKTVVVYGGADLRNQSYELERGCNILVATPGRLLDMTDRGKLSLANVAYLCIDEADRMLDMGFEPQIRKIVEELPGVELRQTLMFSATFPREIQRLAEDFLKEYVFLRVGRVGSTTDYITQKVMYVEDMNKKDRLLDYLEKTEGLTLVFVETKRLADHLEEFLYNQNFSVISIHGDRSQKEREMALEAFRSGQARILVATDVAARGLDVKDVKHVVNYDLPHDINDYVHRIGRTGRCGTPGNATAFFNEKNKNIAKDLVELMEESGQEVDSFLYQYANPQPFSRNTRGKRGGGGGGGMSKAGGRWGSGFVRGGRSNSDFGKYSANGNNSSNYNEGSSNNNNNGPTYSQYHISDNNEGGTDSWW